MGSLQNRPLIQGVSTRQQVEETPKALQFGLAYADGDSYMSLLQQFR